MVAAVGSHVLSILVLPEPHSFGNLPPIKGLLAGRVQGSSAVITALLYLGFRFHRSKVCAAQRVSIESSLLFGATFPSASIGFYSAVHKTFKFLEL